MILWADTFTNHFEPEVGIAAVEVLEDAGFNLTVPEGHLCCGRPLYDYGMLDRAESYLRTVLDRLRRDIRAGVPVVGLEPSCVAVFRDELTKLWPDDEDAKRLAKQTLHFAEFLAEREWTPPQLEGRALLHGHCHHKATGGIAPEKQLLERMGLEVEELEAGCCGMAGGWGYEKGHYEVSIACGERVLLPRVREADPKTLIVAGGFSCRSQIEQAGTGRRALHPAQVLGLAGAAARPYPERAVPGRPAPSLGRRARRAAAVAAVTTLAGGALIAAAKR